jgi:hypothetical protein
VAATSVNQASTESQLAQIDKRLAELQGQPEVHEKEVALNQAWVERCRKQISDAGAGLHPDLQQQLTTAVQRMRMHAYLARENQVEIRWLRTLRVQME